MIRAEDISLERSASCPLNPINDRSSSFGAQQRRAGAATGRAGQCSPRPDEKAVFGFGVQYSGMTAGGARAAQTFWGTYHRYLNSLQQRPVATKSLTAAAVGAAGDTLAQLIEAQARAPQPPRANQSIKTHFNWKRLILFASFMGIVSAPVSHYWYLWLSRRFPQTGLSAVSKRVACDQLFMAPAIIPVTLFYLEYGGRKFVAGDKSNDTLQRALYTAGQTTGPTLLANWTIWPAAQLINFMFIRNELQVLFANLVGVGWNTFLSLVAAANLQKSEETATKAT
ncbi:hypothetical protein F1559_001770 [Cyanidiococcus yangmingshanensis]|uniref:Protein Mpv17 n=1 Tax=Cyanidiococcus yangmingshanensis TaxID=2690220 RepID=A0A7J7INI4_9RHOD|nr:hypothetical protein F1559_001770 [Cyanidiococcus yangmingshanensis]